MADRRDGESAPATDDVGGNMSVREAGRKGGRRVAELIARAKLLDQPKADQEE